MNILITGNYNNLKRMTVMLYSLFMQEPGEVNVYIPSVKADDETLRYLSMYVENWQGKRLIPVYTDTNIWSMSEDNSCLSIEIIYTLCKELDKNIQRILCLDTDMASEMVQYSKNNILTQAGQSMLAQANQQTQGVLYLLQ